MNPECLVLLQNLIDSYSSVKTLMKLAIKVTKTFDEKCKFTTCTLLANLYI